MSFQYHLIAPVFLILLNLCIRFFALLSFRRVCVTVCVIRLLFIDSLHYCRAMLYIARPMPSCGVCVSVMFVDCVKTNKYSIKIFHHRVATPF